jgi:hypothetical protein
VSSGILGRHSVAAEWADVPWLSGLRRVPANATWPRFMTPPHPNAVGSFGAQFEKSALAQSGRPLRWWQRLTGRRVLEHDAAGELCWPEWFLSLSRQGGKSWFLRALAMWRLEQAGRLGEPQFVMHVGNRLVNATEVQAPARAWAKGQGNGWRAFEAQGTQEVRDPDGNRWRCFAQNAVYGFSAGLSLVDEAWGIEPTMIERRWPQLGLISTAHGRATSLCIDRRRAALAGGSGLILEWSGPPWLDLGDRDGWRMASPEWSPQREALMLRAYRKALTARSSRLDEQDPVTTFRSQWLNQWPERSLSDAGLAGEPILGDGVWAGLEAEADIDGPVTFAIEDNAGVSVAIAAAGRTADDRIAVSAYSVTDRALGWRWIAGNAEHHPGSTVLVGSSLAEDPEVIELPCRVETMAYADTRHALSLLRTVAARQGVAHSFSPGLAEQVDLCRVADSTTGAGLRVTSGDRWDILRAAAWAIAAVERERQYEPSVY